MRFNGKEISRLCDEDGPVAIEGVLLHMRPQANDWSDWYQQPSFKERTFKLALNMLFYFRANEPEPLGVLVLENVRVEPERQRKGGVFYAFSATFADGKHVFACRREEDVARWVRALRAAPYEHWRERLAVLRAKLSLRTGQEYVAREERPNPPRRKNKSTFYAEIKTETAATTAGETRAVNGTVPVSNLIDL